MGEPLRSPEQPEVNRALLFKWIPRKTEVGVSLGPSLNKNSGTQTLGSLSKQETWEVYEEPYCISFSFFFGGVDPVNDYCTGYSIRLINSPVAP